jgi:hypothetical protein
MNGIDFETCNLKKYKRGEGEETQPSRTLQGIQGLY